VILTSILRTTQHWEIKKNKIFQLKFTLQLYKIIQALNKLEMGAKEKGTIIVSHILGHIFFLSRKWRSGYRFID
jgi:hypothetical protein